METLAPRQKDAFDKIKSFIAKHGYAPTSDELGRLLGISQTGAMNHIRALTRKKAIVRQPGKSRTISIA